MITEWQNISGLVQGDIQYSLQTTSVSSTNINFTLIAYSERWNSFDISFLYRSNKEEEWRNDAFIEYASVEKVNKNHIVGLDASKYGSINAFSWNYSKNSLVYGENIEVKISALPRIKQFSSGPKNAISQAFSDNMAYLDGIASVKPIGTNKEGNIVCISPSQIFIRADINSPNLHIRGGFVDISHAVQINSKNYIVADRSSSQIFELDESLATILQTVSVPNVEYFEYNEETETLLVTRKSDNLIEEYTWGDGDYGTLLWGSTSSLYYPEAASYKTDDATRIVVADSKNRIALISRDLNETRYISKFSFYEDESSFAEITNFYKPFRVFWTGETIYIVEKEGRVLSFDDAQSSSSSSIDSSSSSSN